MSLMPKRACGALVEGCPRKFDVLAKPGIQMTLIVSAECGAWQRFSGFIVLPVVTGIEALA